MKVWLIIVLLFSLFFLTSCMKNINATEECMDFCKVLKAQFDNINKGDLGITTTMRHAGSIRAAECRSDLTAEEIKSFYETKLVVKEFNLCNDTSLWCDCKFKNGDYLFNLTMSLRKTGEIE